ncbi:hypothetical protein J437_LFUL004527 [Ladona fulva]|uniref:GRIP domain-containing protein n=1 Tax=Ladona fulva TaxID=123851 RepID=A0A8K0NZY8_LADFU|nr:hypothetical protein J437_LFUL004527 [Ladona fulva]
MDKEKELQAIIEKQQDKINQYKARLGDIITAYKGLGKEKEALEASLKALNTRPKVKKHATPKGKKENATDSEKQKEEDGQLSKSLTEIKTLSESLTTLSEEKSRLEASYQADRKRLLLERDELEVTVKELSEKLLWERQERGTEQSNYERMIKRWEEAEIEWRRLAASQEERIRSLESRVALLSDSLAAQHALHQRDHGAMQALKERMAELALERVSLYANKPVPREEPPIAEEKEEVKGTVTLPPELAAFTLSSDEKSTESSNKDDKPNEETKVADSTELLEIKNKPLIQEISLLQEKVKDLTIRLHQEEENHRRTEQNTAEIVRLEKEHWERCLAATTSEFRVKTSQLEGEMLRQRQRSLALLDEKDAEITRLRASLEIGATKSGIMLALADGAAGREGRIGGPPLLHHAHEAARLEVELREVRAERRILENQLHDARKEIAFLEEEKKTEVNLLQAEVDRLKRCQSREGAHLEYLKNVVLSYLLTTRESRRCHMLSAIAAVLRFTPEECNRVSKLHKFST